MLKDQSDGLPVQRGSWEEDNEARAELYDRAKAMLLSFEKRRSKLSRTVSFKIIQVLLIFIETILLGYSTSSSKLGES